MSMDRVGQGSSDTLKDSRELHFLAPTPLETSVLSLLNGVLTIGPRDRGTGVGYRGGVTDAPLNAEGPLGPR